MLRIRSCVDHNSFITKMLVCRHTCQLEGCSWFVLTWRGLRLRPIIINTVADKALIKRYVIIMSCTCTQQMMLCTAVYMYTLSNVPLFAAPR